MPQHRDGRSPRLPDDDAEGDDCTSMPELPPISGEHGQIIGWVHRALIAVQQDLQRLNRRIAHMEGGEEERAEWRRSVDDKLAAIATSVGDSGATGWRVMFTQRNLPLTMMGVLVMFLCAVLWGVLFGADDIDRKLDRIRGNQAAVEVTQ
jgi:hypothetical protein